MKQESKKNNELEKYVYRPQNRHNHSGIAVVVWFVGFVKPDLLPFDLTYPAITIFTVCEAVVYWNKKRKWAYLLIAGAVISLAFYILEMML